MRLYARLLVCAVAVCLFPSCQNTPIQNAPVTGTSIQQEMATLAFLAYIGDSIKDPVASEVEKRLAGCMTQALADEAPGWELAWGPAVYRFPVAELYDNMMYVVRQKGSPESPGNLAIVVRGTNPPAILDWLVEDFDVVDQVPWPGAPSEFSQAKTSKGASEGLHILRDKLKWKGQSLTEFLEGEVGQSSGVRVYVTGHSLGGALAPTLALWLEENRAEWDPQDKAELAVHPLAGPTAGNADFAAYYDRELGGQTHRIWNPYDIMPLAWNPETMEKVAGLYEPDFKPGDLDHAAIDGLRDLVKDKGYAQIDPTAKALPGAIQTANTCNPKKPMDWSSEVWWQHHWGYQCALGILVSYPSYKECPSSLNCSEVVCPKS